MTDFLDPSIEELAGQRLMLGFDGTSFNDDLRHIIRDIKTGGIILFARNIETPDQVAALCADCQSFARTCGLLPLIISVDQEGGTVARCKDGFTRFDGNPAIKTLQDANRFAEITARELGAVGINMNLAPVLDVVPQGVDSIMRDRVFQGDAQVVSTLGNQVIHTLQEKGMMAVAKHFPGIGRTVLDSHFHLPKLDVGINILESTDLIPFVHAMENKVSGMMLSHIFYPRLDAVWQASLSPAIAHDLLRHTLGFKGLVMTDDLDMKAIGHDIKTCIRQILNARIDMALICHKGPNIDTAADEIYRLISSDAGLLDWARQSYHRIREYKQRFLAQNGA